MTRGMMTILADYRALTANVIKRLCHIAELFPYVFTETRLTETLLQLLKKWLEVAIMTFKQSQQPGATKTLNGGQQQLKVRTL